jgi:hypothetical protein
MDMDDYEVNSNYIRNIRQTENTLLWCYSITLETRLSLSKTSVAHMWVTPL